MLQSSGPNPKYHLQRIPPNPSAYNTIKELLSDNL